jgi:putative transposase
VQSYVRQAIFFHEDDYNIYLGYLREALAKRGARRFALVLMTNHVHLLILCETPGGISGLMESVGRRYVRYINATYRRSGTLFEGRFKSSLVDSECYLLTCMGYIELNPVRAGMVDNPGQYPWSSFRTYVGKSVIDWLSESKKYRRLAAAQEARKLAYRDLLISRWRLAILNRYACI